MNRASRTAGLAATICMMVGWAAEARDVGVHVGAAVPLAQLGGNNSQTIGGSFLSVATPIGVNIALGERLSLDLETVVATPLRPSTGSTSLTVDPGLVYNWGAFATGMRVAFQIGQSANIGLVPLINKGFPVGAGTTWFIEMAFPAVVKDGSASVSTVFHTGFGF